MSKKNNQNDEILSKKTTFGERLRNYRNIKKLSQNELASKLGFTKNTSISSFESGKTYPSFQTLQKMAEVLEIDLHWLITGKTVDLAIREKFLNAVIPVALNFILGCQEQIKQLDIEIEASKKIISENIGDIKEERSLLKSLEDEKKELQREMKGFFDEIPIFKEAIHQACKKINHP